jgi:hypothetical protein
VIETPSRRFLSVNEAIAFIDERYTPMDRGKFYRRLRHGNFKVVKEHRGRPMIDVQTLIDYYETLPTVEYNFAEDREPEAV